MVYTTNQLISDAYYASGIVSREFETVSGQQVSDGLFWLNEVLADKRVNHGMVPYETKYSFTVIPGVETYFIPKIVHLDTVVFFLDSVRYAMVYSQRNQYFGSPRVENIQSLPFEWYFERHVNGGNLHIYFKPDRTYPFEVHGIFDFDDVSLGQDLTKNVTTADLGIPTIYSGGSLSQNSLVVNGFDLEGVYDNIGALINYINTGIIPGVQANLVLNHFVLSSLTEPPIQINVQTSGYPPIGTKFIGNVSAFADMLPYGTIYNNGSSGVGATLTSPGPAVLVVDGYTVQLGDRILVNVASPFEFQNGSYSLTTLGTGAVPWVLTRTTNYNQSYQIGEGNLFTVTNGTIYGGKTFVQTAQVSDIGVSPISFMVFSGITFSNFSTISLPDLEIFNAVGFDQFYLTYLKYALSERICTEYNFSVPALVEKQLNEYEHWIKKKSRLIDLAMKKVSTLQKRNTFNWAFCNLGKGWIRPY